MGKKKRIMEEEKKMGKKKRIVRNIKTRLSDLPIEILSHILAKVPVESLFFNCQFVSKIWHTVVNCPRFAITHLVNQVPEKSQLVTCDFSNHGVCSRMHLVNQINSSNDLVSFEYEMTTIFNGYRKSLNYFVCQGIFIFLRVLKPPILFNPFTREFIELPELSPPPMIMSQLFRHPGEAYGLGFDFKSRVHKVVAFVVNGVRRIYNAQVLTLVSGALSSWREICTDIPECVDPKTIVTTRGYMHWLCTQMIDEINEDVLLSFNVEKEEFGLTNFPKLKTSYTGGLYLSYWKQSLAAVYFLTKAECWIEVWLLKNGKWNKEFKSREMDLKTWYREKKLRLDYPYNLRRVLPVRLLGEWNEGLLFEVIEGKRYMLYNPNEDRIKFMGVLPAYLRIVRELILFTPSFTSLASGDRLDDSGILRLEDIYDY
ncbi:hypothetical protein ACFE04_007472 [Oxalis oulophora]